MAQTVRVHPLVRERLKDLPSALQGRFGIPADQQDIVAALVHGTTLGELAGLVTVFNRYTDAMNRGATPEDHQQPPAIT